MKNKNVRSVKNTPWDKATLNIALLLMSLFVWFGYDNYTEFALLEHAKNYELIESNFPETKVFIENIKERSDWFTESALKDVRKKQIVSRWGQGGSITLIFVCLISMAVRTKREETEPDSNKTTFLTDEAAPPPRDTSAL